MQSNTDNVIISKEEMGLHEQRLKDRLYNKSLQIQYSKAGRDAIAETETKKGKSVTFTQDQAHQQRTYARVALPMEDPVSTSKILHQNMMSTKTNVATAQKYQKQQEANATD